MAKEQDLHDIISRYPFKEPVKNRGRIGDRSQIVGKFGFLDKLFCLKN